jgi:hypothetical protein
MREKRRKTLLEVFPSDVLITLKHKEVFGAETDKPPES